MFSKPHLHYGDSSLFWHDAWHQQPLVDSSPELFSFALNKKISIKRAFEQDELSSLFYLPLSQTAFLQLQNVQQIMESIVLSNDKDKWIYSWGYDWFASSKIYHLLVGHLLPGLRMALEK